MVDLDHDAVDVEIELVPPAADLLVVGEAALHSAHHLELRGDREAPLAQALGQVPVRGEARVLLDATEPVEEDGQRTRCGDPGVELAQPSRRGVARIRVDLLARLPLSLVQALEARTGHVHLAPDFEHPRMSVSPHAQGHRGNRAQVSGHVLAALAVAACRASFEAPVAVDEARREAVELRLERVLHLLDFEAFAHPPVEVAQLLLAESVAEREHGRGVHDFREPRERRRAHPLGRGVGTPEARMRFLQRHELAHQAIVLGVRNLGVVEDVVAVVVVLDAFAKLGRASGPPALRSSKPNRCEQPGRLRRASLAPPRGTPARVRRAAGAGGRGPRSAHAGD